jgi:8-oxo-dGTP diphosphatase
MSEGSYRNPVPTVDIIIEIDGRIVLIERKNDPVGWALPGGFVDYGETLATAARREAKEETELDVDIVELFHMYSDPSRDARLHTISAVFIARGSGEPVGADDAAIARLFAPDELPDPLVFDHALIVKDYYRYRDTGERPPADR